MTHPKTGRLSDIPQSPTFGPNQHKVMNAKAALSKLENGQTIFLGSGVGEPTFLTDTLAQMAEEFRDIEVIHLAAHHPTSKLAAPELIDSFRFSTFFIGQGISDVLEDGNVDYMPMDVRELPKALKNGVIRINVALIQVSRPDDLGLVSLGVSVDVTKAALEHAELVIAQVNPHMPITLGDSLIPLDDVDYIVEADIPLETIRGPEIDPVSFTIGRHIAGLIDNGMTLHFDRGPISSAAMRYLDTKKDLGIHTDVLTDDIWRLINSRAVTNRLKPINKGKTIATMAIGCEALYQDLDRNPYIELHTIDEVNDPYIIGQHPNMVSIHTVHEIELTGMARVDRDAQHLGHLPSNMNFINGARRSKGGFTVIALPSTTKDGTASTIVPFCGGPGLFFPRSKVDYVVTEYGVVNLFGMSIRERAIALIHIAHPKFRAELLAEAKRIKYIGEAQTVPPESGSVYPDQYEFYRTFKDEKIFFRPVRPIDAKRLQHLFYSLTPKDKRMRYHGTIKALAHDTSQRMATVDYSQDMAIIGLVGPKLNPKVVAEGRYTYNPANNMGEFDIVVEQHYQGRGIGTFLANHLSRIAYSRGLTGVYAYIINQNGATIALLDKAWPTAMKYFADGDCTFVLKFPKADIERPKDAIVVYAAESTEYSYGKSHPFNPKRARFAVQLLKKEGYVDEPWMRMESPKSLTKSRLYESHDPAFIEAIEQIGQGIWSENFLQFGIGTEECPAFKDLFEYVRLYTAATMTCVDLVTEENANIAFNPLGGFHHSSRSAAEGFCYVNDAIVAIDQLLARGHRVAYIDIDAHHGNGVQDAYYQDDRVLTVSLHQTGNTIYPYSGFETEIGAGAGLGYTINVPLPEETDDDAYLQVFKRVVTPAMARFTPTVVVAVIGADTHRNDPLTHLAMTNNGMVAVMKEIRDYATHLILLGSGGYDMETTTRAWCRMWAAANRIDALPDYLLVLGGAFFGGGDIQGASIVDPPFQVSGNKKTLILNELDRIARFHETQTLPIIGGEKSTIEYQI